jgi:hypothetical protein
MAAASATEFIAWVLTLRGSTTPSFSILPSHIIQIPSITLYADRKAKVLVVRGAYTTAQNSFLFFAKDVKKCLEVRKVIPLCRVQLPPPP